MWRVGRVGGCVEGGWGCGKGGRVCVWRWEGVCVEVGGCVWRVGGCVEGGRHVRHANDLLKSGYVNVLIVFYYTVVHSSASLL